MRFLALRNCLYISCFEIRMGTFGVVHFLIFCDLDAPCRVSKAPSKKTPEKLRTISENIAHWTHQNPDAPCGSKSGLVFYHGVTAAKQKQEEKEEEEENVFVIV